ncbi:MAG: GNAT family N-acetyltransferase [Chloroflexota bacterium]
MHIECQLNKQLKPFQHNALARLSTAVYPPHLFKDRPKPPMQWAEKQWSLLIWEGKELVSLVGMLVREGTLNGRSLLMGGIGSVKTHPEARGRGYAGVGMEKAAVFLRDEQQVDISVLFCRQALFTYYQRFGWQPFAGDVFAEQLEGRTRFSFNETMVLSGQRVALQTGVLDLCGKPW